MTDRVHIRLAHAEDAQALARVGERTFRDTFAVDNTPEDMDLHCRESYGADIQAAEIADPKMQTLLVEAGGEIIGFCQLRWGHAPECITASAPGEILRLYVVSAWHGQGIAPSLMEAAFAALRHRGSDAVWLGVWERNPRAIAFYGKYGFSEVGSHVFTVGTDPQRDLLMVRPLARD